MNSNLVSDSFDSLPVLVISYNRPDLLRQVLDCLKDNGMSNVYISIDGVSGSDSTSCELVEQCRFIAQEVKFDSKKLRFSSEHLGCYKNVTQSIDWFFTDEMFGVVVEDDLFFEADFLKFVHFYKSISKEKFRIGTISGYRFPESLKVIGEVSDGLSRYPSSWGWATWKENWSKFRHTFNIGEKLKLLLFYLWRLGPKGMIIFWRVLKRLESGSLDSWAYRWLFTHELEGWRSVIPSETLILNMGHRPDATHTKERRSKEFLGNWSEQQKSREQIHVDEEYNLLLESKIYGVRKNPKVNALI